MSEVETGDEMGHLWTRTAPGDFNPEVNAEILRERGWPVTMPVLIASVPFSGWPPEETVSHGFKTRLGMKAFIQRVGRNYEMDSYWISEEPIGERWETGLIESMSDSSPDSSSAVRIREVRFIVLFGALGDGAVQYVRMLLSKPASSD